MSPRVSYRRPEKFLRELLAQASLVSYETRLDLDALTPPPTLAGNSVPAYVSPCREM